LRVTASGFVLAGVSLLASDLVEAGEVIEKLSERIYGRLER